MNIIQAFTNGEANRGKELMVFDWNKAAEMIKETKPLTASAGLKGDWEWTGGEIYSDGNIETNSYTYLASTWAVPELELEGIRYECYKMEKETDNWNSDTKWPESALNILKGGKENV